MRRFFLALVGLGVVGTLLVASNIFQVWTAGRAHDTASVDAIVVMGAAQYDGRPTAQFKARLDHAFDLWSAGVAPIIVTTGGNQPGDRFTEGGSGAKYLNERGVDSSSLLIEESGSTTRRSLVGVAELLKLRGADKVVIVTEPFHALRSKLIAQDLGLIVSLSSTRTSPMGRADVIRHHVVEGVGITIAQFVGFSA
ncbi:MAG: YdcF family protein, partial [Ilumatobacteraceae bacterium]